jgi:hypothetical protein
MRKTTTKNSTPNRLHVNPENLNRHYGGLRRLSNHQIPPINHTTQQKRKEKWYTQLFSQTMCIYAACNEIAHTYT